MNNRHSVWICSTVDSNDSDSSSSCGEAESSCDIEAVAGSIQISVVLCWIHTDLIDAADADADLFILFKQSEISCTCNWTLLISKITVSYLSLITDFWTDQYFCIVSFLRVTVLIRELSTHAANLWYFSQLKREWEWCRNFSCKITESCNKIILSAQRRCRNPEPARSSRTTWLSVLSGW